jgi:hypothetical protein
MGLVVQLPDNKKNLFRRLSIMIGILAYGSLLTAPGDHLSPLIERCAEAVTPFPVEYARQSKGRGYAPTLIPYNDGSPVNGKVLILKEEVDKQTALDALYSREKFGPKGDVVPYVVPSPVGINDIVLENSPEFAEQFGLECVLYTKLGPNREVQGDPLTAENLAKWAINSITREKKPAKEGEDGITYLRDAKAKGIVTPLTEAYEAEILRQTGTATLDEALENVKSKATSK